MTPYLIFGAIYLFGIYAFFRHVTNTAVHVDENGSPVVIQFPREGEALRFHHFHVHDASGSKLSVRAHHNPSRGGNS